MNKSLDYRVGIFSFGTLSRVPIPSLLWRICHMLPFCLDSVCSPIETVYPDHSEPMFRQPLLDTALGDLGSTDRTPGMDRARRCREKNY